MSYQISQLQALHFCYRLKNEIVAVWECRWRCGGGWWESNGSSFGVEWEEGGKLFRLSGVRFVNRRKKVSLVLGTLGLSIYAS